MTCRPDVLCQAQFYLIDIMEDPIRKTAVQLAYSAGEIIRKNFFKNSSAEWKKDGTPVTNTDLEVNGLVLHTLREATPTFSIMAEEGSHIIPGSEYTWVCDPLDGTVAFTGGLPTCVFSLALLHNHQTIFAIVYDPFLDQVYTAETANGSFMNGHRISVSKTAVATKGLVGIPFWQGEHYDSTLLLDNLKKKDIFVTNIFSIVYMSMLVACGKLSAVIYLNTSAHDGAAASLIVKEAGGMVTNLFGNDQDYDKPLQGCLLSNGRLHHTYLQIIKESGIVSA